MALLIAVLYLFFININMISATQLNIFRIDERWICNIKLNCLDCLKLPHCSWCPIEKRCFSEHLPYTEQYCKEKRIQHPTYGMSLEENAACACASPEMRNSCPPGGFEKECSGRGKCLCGRCFCDSSPNSSYPNKFITGDHCEYDNFSCDGPKCSEGPYYLYQEAETNNGEEVVKA